MYFNHIIASPNSSQISLISILTQLYVFLSLLKKTQLLPYKTKKKAKLKRSPQNTIEFISC